MAVKPAEARRRQIEHRDYGTFADHNALATSEHVAQRWGLDYLSPMERELLQMKRLNAYLALPIMERRVKRETARMREGLKLTGVKDHAA
jgi:hypothetical protein